MTLTIKHKLWGGYALILALLLTVALVSYVNLSDIQSKIKTVAEDSQPKVIASLELASQIHKSSSSLGYFMLSNDELDKQAYLNNLSTVQVRIQNLQEIVSHSEDRSTIDDVNRIADLATRFNGYKDAMFELASDAEKNLPALHIATQELEPLGTKLLQLTTDIVLTTPETDDPDELSELILAAHELRYHWAMVISNVRSYLAFRNQSVIDNINLFRGGIRQITGDLSGKEDLLSEDQIDALDEFIMLEQDYFSAFDKAYALHSGEKWRTDAYLVRSELGPLLKQVEQALESMVGKQQASINSTTHELQSEVVRTIGWLSFFVVTAIGLAIVIVYFSATHIINPLRKAVTAMEDVASVDGDLTKRLDDSANDEIGQLGAAFNDFSVKILSMIRSISFVGGDVKGSTVKLSSAAENAKNQMIQLKGEACQVAAAVTQMSATVNEVASSAAATAEATREAESEAQNGSQVVSETIEVINQLHSQFVSSSDEIQHLNTECDNISDVVSVIREIAETTNLLSLNAAIEAARAGEAGRGFAVVADEVRGLATRTQNSVQEIQRSIERLQADSKSTVQAMEQGGRQVDVCVNKAAEAGRSLSNITEVVGTIHEMNLQVASAVEEQCSVFTEISQNIEYISESSEEISKEGIVTANEGSHLEKLSEELVKLVGMFSLGGGGSREKRAT